MVFSPDLSMVIWHSTHVILTPISMV
jgi:hypothetical protein